MVAGEWVSSQGTESLSACLIRCLKQHREAFCLSGGSRERRAAADEQPVLAGRRRENPVTGAEGLSGQSGNNLPEQTVASIE